MEDDRDYYEYPIIGGQGALHTLTEDAGRVFGREGARIRVRIKRAPIGFKIPARQAAR